MSAPHFAAEPFVTYPPSPFAQADESSSVHTSSVPIGGVPLASPPRQPFPAPVLQQYAPIGGSPLGGSAPFGAAIRPMDASLSTEGVAARQATEPYEPYRSGAAPLQNLMAAQVAANTGLGAIPAVPPDWVPDDKVVGCMRCAKHFTLLVRRHHCRMCGRIFCSDCCSNFSLLPRQFNRADPQRACVRCFEVLLPMQRQLMLSVSKASRDGDFRQPAINAPTTRSMRKEIAKAAATLQEFVGMPDSAIPSRLLESAKGIAFLTMLKGGFLWAGKMGTGLVVARNTQTGGWSAPSAIGAVGCSFGLQAGGELNSVVVVLNNDAALAAFSGAGHLTLGAGLSIAVGPWGRSVEAEVGGGDAGAVACYSYCSAKGAFAGVAIEGTLVFCRADLNQTFYGRPVTPRQLLSGQIPPPRAAGPLFRALELATTLS
jgi:lipid-binding SYLF domain-containing protein